MNEATYAAWWEWVCKGNRNPYSDDYLNADEIERGKYLAYYLSWDNAADMKASELTIFDLQRMEDDPEADSVHDTAMIAAADWERGERDRRS